MPAILTIGGTTVTFLEETLTISKTVDERKRLQCDLHDATGLLHFQKDEQVILTDPVLGVMFDGVLNTDEEFPLYPTSEVRHTIDCVDFGQARASERTYTRTYTTAQPAGKLVIDQLSDVMLAEGITQNFAQRYDTTDSDFNAGLLNNVAGTLTVDDGCLELTKSGSDMAFAVILAAGTLTNVAFSGGSLAPTLTPTIKLSCSLPYASGTNVIYMTVWTGSITLTTNDTCIVTLWIPSTNPSFSATINCTFSDGGDLNLGTEVPGVNAYDQNNLPTETFIGATLTDLSSFAKDQWYTRTFTFPSAYNGKTVTSVQVGMGGSATGDYVAYFKNITLKTTAIFSSSFQTTPTIQRAQSFLTTTAKVTLVQSFDQNNCSYLSGAISIDAVKLVRSSYIQWLANIPDPATLPIYVSYDGNSYLQCTNNAALPLLLAGSNVAGISVYFKLLFQSGTDPTIYPSISSLTASLVSAPNATKSDVTASFGTQTAWNTGTHSNTQALSDGTLTLASLSRNWNDNLITNQTFFQVNGCTQAASSGAYRITVPVRTSSPNASAESRFDFAGQVMDFTLEMDVTNPNTFNNSSLLYIFYRQTQWDDNINRNSYGYAFVLTGGELDFNIGTNDISGGASTNLATVSGTYTGTYHVKLVVSGNSHSIYFNNSSTPTINITDTKIQAPGYIGVGGYVFFQNPGGGGNGTFVFDNLVLTPATSGTWTSGSTSISSLGTCDTSAIAWTENNTDNQVIGSVQVQASIDGGSSYQTCTNGGEIPGLTSGTNVSGKSVLTKVLLNGISKDMLPSAQWLYWRVLGQYPGSSGTRSTAPMGVDYVDRGNQSGFGTASDGQTWTPTGTGTPAVASNRLTITNTTGDFFEQLGSRTDDDMDMTVPFMLSASTITGGMTLRYVDSNNYYKLQASTTSIDIIKKVAGVAYTLQNITSALVTNTLYYMRFRVVDQLPVLLYGRIWQSGTLEDQENWTINTSD